LTFDLRQGRQLEHPALRRASGKWWVGCESGDDGQARPDAGYWVLNIQSGMITSATNLQSTNRLLAPIQKFCESSLMSLVLFTIVRIAGGITCLHAITVAKNGTKPGLEW
jgi:hypothetical protein